MGRQQIQFVLLIALLLAGCTAQAQPPLDTLVDIGTHRLHIYCMGTRSPTVVIDTGVGNVYHSWESIMETLSQEVRVCAYDRAGYGQSEPGPLPRHSQRVAEELHSLLASAGEEGPFILVGHSLGGLNMQVYAHIYPKEVAGLLLLDPFPLAWMRGEVYPELRGIFSQDIVGIHEVALVAHNTPSSEAKGQRDFLTTINSEYAQLFGATTSQVNAISSFGDLPLIVIGATEADPAFGEYAESFRMFWNEESELLAKKSTAGKFTLAEMSRHCIHRDRPQVVIYAILDLIAQAQ